MKKMISQRVIEVLLVIFVFCAANAFGQEDKFPVKPINIYIGYSPGASTGNTGMIFAEGVKKYLNQPVIVNFKPGAAQLIAAEFVKSSKPDGYTLFYPAHAELSAKVASESSAGKFRLEDLDSLGAGPYAPYIATVNAESPWKSVEDFIAAAKKSPGKLSHGSAGVGGTTHILQELFSRKAGIVLNHVPFSGGAALITALLGGHIHMCTNSFPSYGGHIKPGGGLRALIVFDRKRHLGLPDVPTALERGFDIVMASWWGLQAPKGLPKGVRATLVQAIASAAKDPEVISSLAKIGTNVTYLSPDEEHKKAQEEYKLFLDTWEKTLKK